MSFSNYEQTVIIDSIALSGVIGANGSYGIKESPIKVAGVGFIDALVDGPMEGNFSISRKMVSTDPLLGLTPVGDYLYDENYISGAILYDNGSKGFGFTKGRVTRYSVTCSVGDIPSIDTDITVFGDLGSGINVAPATVDHPEIRFPNQGSISVAVSDFVVDSITDFSYSRALSLQPLYAIPKGTSSNWNSASAASYSNQDPIQVDTQYPIETDINFTMVAHEYQARQMKDKFETSKKTDVVIEIRDALDDSVINSFTGRNVRLIGETTTSSVEGELSISLTYKGYETLHNPAS
jgi:hypothetical protein